MATSRFEHTEPKHIVIWLDQNFRNPDEYRILKRTFETNIDPRYAISITVERSFGLLHVFNREEDFFDCLQKNQDKRIFFITSGTLGRTTVPRIIQRHVQAFTDPITNNPYSSIYILCHNIALQMDWEDDYLDYIQTFNFDAELLERLTRDIADYYVERGIRLRQDQEFESALLYLYWARKLYFNYDKMQQNITNDSLTEVHESEGRRRIGRLIDEIECELARESYYETDDSDAHENEPCS